MEGAPARDRFVVSAREPADSLAALGEVESLGHVDLTLLHLSAPADEPEVSWRAIRDRLDQHEWAAPVLVDEDGGERFPTGAIAVRFHEPPPEDRLEAIAREHGLRVVGRNEFVREQVELEPENRRDAYLHEVVARLARLPEARLAWATTVSRYARH